MFEMTVLGCGSSSGTPVVGCHCASCSSFDKRNQRTRASAYIKTEQMGILIDTGPDLRFQALREQICRVDAVLYTHPHADHLNGIDDLRAFCHIKKSPIPLYGNAFTLDNIRTRFAYTLLPVSKRWDKPALQLEEASSAFYLDTLPITPVPLQHGNWPCTGWRIGGMAWLTDLSDIPDSSLPLLQDLKLLFLDCLFHEPYPSHLSVSQSLDWARKLGAQHTVLIHMTHKLEYHALSALCPAGVAVGYDGMRFTL